MLVASGAVEISGPTRGNRGPDAQRQPFMSGDDRSAAQVSSPAAAVVGAVPPPMAGFPAAHDSGTNGRSAGSAGTLGSGAARLRTVARLPGSPAAVDASRADSGSSPHRHSMSFSTDV